MKATIVNISIVLIISLEIKAISRLYIIKGFYYFNFSLFYNSKSNLSSYNNITY